MPEPTPGTVCACPNCNCTDVAAWVSDAGVAYCGCCFADCPDVHPPGVAPRA